MLAAFWSVEQYTKLWRRLRNDPRRNLTIPELDDSGWPDADTIEQFTASLEKLSSTIAKMSGAKLGETQIKGLGILDKPPDKVERASITICKTLISVNAEIGLSLELGASAKEGTGELLISLEDEEDRCGSYFAAAKAEITKPKLHYERDLILSSPEDVWVVISFLRGTVKFTHERGQLWAHILEHDVWLVQYKLNGKDYGLRNSFKNSLARKYGYDR